MGSFPLRHSEHLAPQDLPSKAPTHMRRLHSPRFVKVIRRSEFFLAFGLLVAWWCFYEVMRECDLTHPALLSQTIPAQRIMPAPDERVKSSTDEPADIMERPATINVPQMSLFSLAKILSASGLKLDYQAKDKDMKLDCPKQGDKVLAEILVDLLRPHGLGFFRQGDTIHLVKMTLTTEKKVRDQESAPLSIKPSTHHYQGERGRGHRHVGR